MTLLFGIVMTLSLVGCGASSTLVTDTGSGKQQVIPKEDYLEQDIPKQQEQTVENVYQSYILAKGMFTEEALVQKLKRSYINVPTVRISLDGMDASFGEYVATDMQYVEMGDVIATVHTEVDEIAIEEAKLKLQRIKERYQAAEIRMGEELQEIIDEKALIYNDYKKSIMDLRYKQRQLDWENEKYQYESQIASAQEKIDKLTEVGAIYEVKATTTGTVKYNKQYAAGATLKDGDYICHIMSGSEVYVVTDIQADQYYYGMEVEFDGRNGLIPGKVASGGNWALYGNLDSANVIYRLEFDQDISQLDMTGLNNLTMSGKLKTVENVVLVPKKAVTVEGEEFFVTVMREDGSFLKTEFLPGGSNAEYYWVLEGLKEGTQIVYH